MRAKQQYLSRMESMVKEKDKTSSEQLVKEYTRHFLNEEAAPGIVAEYDIVKKLLPGVDLAELNAMTKQYIVDKNRDVIIMSSENGKR